MMTAQAETMALYIAVPGQQARGSRWSGSVTE
jgi:hypothetical protein